MDNFITFTLKYFEYLTPNVYKLIMQNNDYVDVYSIFEPFNDRIKNILEQKKSGIIENKIARNEFLDIIDNIVYNCDTQKKLALEFDKSFLTK